MRLKRTSLAMIDNAIQNGRINGNTILIEPTSGITGKALAFVAAARDVSPDYGCGLLQHFLSSASDHDVRAFLPQNAWLWPNQSVASACDYHNLSAIFCLRGGRCRK